MADDPENTLIFTLEGGPVTIRLRPDLAPGPRGADQGAGARGLLRRRGLPPRDPRFHGPGRRPDRHGDRRLAETRSALRVLQPGARARRLLDGADQQPALGQQPVLHLLHGRAAPRSQLHGLGRGHRRHGAHRRPAQGRAAARARQDLSPPGWLPTSLKLSDFDFDLPDDRIALRPANPRDSARMLVVDAEGGLADRTVRDLPSLLRPGDIVVLNDTKVIPARLSGLREREGSVVRVEATLHRRLSPHRWTAFMKPGRGSRSATASVSASGTTAPASSACSTRRLSRKGEGGEVTLSFDLSGPDLEMAIAERGVMPLPPYIASRRAEDDQDLRGLPDRLRARGRLGRRADRRAAFHARAAGCARAGGREPHVRHPARRRAAPSCR